MRQFWTAWKNMSPLEKKGIHSLQAAKRIILKHIPKDEIIAIYAKGSFVRREMTDKSDVDTVTILKTLKVYTNTQEA
ncbi:MAG: hypothetical protein ABIJ21_07610 [Nanoarchaeota archaeon]